MGRRRAAWAVWAVVLSALGSADCVSSAGSTATRGGASSPTEPASPGAARPGDAASPSVPRVAPAVVCRDPKASDQDDLAVWRHPTDPAGSLVIASDKMAGRLFAYDLQGRTLQVVETPHPGNIDVRYGFPLGGRKVDIVACNLRSGGPRIAVLAVDPASRTLARVDNGRIETGDNYGGALYRSPRSGRFYFITTSYSGRCEQHELADDGAGRVVGRRVRAWDAGLCEAVVADDRAAKIYIADERKGVWELGGEPDDPAPGRLVVRTGEHGLTADVEGLAIHPDVGGGPVLVVSNQSRNRFHVYRLGGDFAFVGAFAVAGARDTDGIEVVPDGLGPPFEKGLFACHTDSGGRPVLLVPWERIAAVLPAGGPAGPTPREGAPESQAMRVSLVVLALALAAGVPPGESAPASASDASPPAAPSPPAYEPTSAYDLRTIEGWQVYVHKRLLGEQKDLGDRALKVLAAKLDEVNRTLPAVALEKLRSVRFWMEAGSKDVVGACYHPSRRWLVDHGFNPEKARCIEIGRPANFLGWIRHQPAVILHELAHAYHHQVLGYDQPDIKAAYHRAMESKTYESVLYFDGRKRRAYAANNDQEYFAELTEAYFGTNDFYPFVRGEVKEHDPVMYAVLRKVWEGKDGAAETKAAATGANDAGTGAKETAAGANDAGKEAKDRAASPAPATSP